MHKDPKNKTIDNRATMGHDRCTSAVETSPFHLVAFATINLRTNKALVDLETCGSHAGLTHQPCGFSCQFDLRKVCVLENWCGHVIKGNAQQLGKTISVGFGLESAVSAAIGDEFEE